MFYNEFELLGLRLKEGYDYVEKFIITEARITHRGEEKPLWSATCPLFEQYKDKIVHIIVDFPTTIEGYSQGIKNLFPGSTWEPGFREAEQRNAAYTYLSTCNPDDVCIVSDLDEIPRYEQLVNNPLVAQGKVRYTLPTYMYNIHYRQVTYNPVYAFSTPIKHVTHDNLTYLRFREQAGPTIRDAFTHFNRFCKPNALLIKEAGMFEGNGTIYDPFATIDIRKRFLLRILRGEWSDIVYVNDVMPKNIGMLSKIHLLDKQEMDAYVERINNSTDETFPAIYDEIIAL